MPKVNAKRQFTIPISQCEALGIHPGDEVVSFVTGKQIIIIKKVIGAAKGILSHIKSNTSLTDQQSLQSTLE